MYPKIITYNCESYCKNVDIVRLLLDKCDILFLQEYQQHYIPFITLCDKNRVLLAVGHTFPDMPAEQSRAGILLSLHQLFNYLVNGKLGCRQGFVGLIKS